VKLCKAYKTNYTSAVECINTATHLYTTHSTSQRSVDHISLNQTGKMLKFLPVFIKGSHYKCLCRYIVTA